MLHETTMSPVLVFDTHYHGAFACSWLASQEECWDLAFQSGLKRLIDEAMAEHPYLAETCPGLVDEAFEARLEGHFDMMEEAGFYLAMAENAVLWSSKREGKTSGYKWAYWW